MWGLVESSVTEGWPEKVYSLRISVCVRRWLLGRKGSRFVRKVGPDYETKRHNIWEAHSYDSHSPDVVVSLKWSLVQTKYHAGRKECWQQTDSFLTSWVQYISTEFTKEKKKGRKLYRIIRNKREERQSCDRNIRRFIYFSSSFMFAKSLFLLNVFGKKVPVPERTSVDGKVKRTVGVMNNEPPSNFRITRATKGIWQKQERFTAF